MRGLHFSWAKTKNLPKPNQYVQLMCNEFSQWAYDEEKSPTYKGKWRSHSFHQSENSFLDLEIGPGNGNHFAYHALKYPERLALAIELKYKPIVQTVRRTVNNGSQNARVIRYNAYLIEDLFSEGELNDVYIHFPDPWELGPQWKHRLITDEYLEKLFSMQRPGSNLEFKTDSPGYFKWALQRFVRSKYQINFASTDLHKSLNKDRNFPTTFEKIFLKKGQPIYYLLASCH
ncbi:MAG: tRNA (guanine-N7)-methyltransferase [Pseudomonadota bacterium]|nr:tRNA (guanine-N7)-methyltransferase [Pseudomonadota bacterium]